MTRKDYAMVAKVLGEARAAHGQPVARDAITAVETRLVAAFAADSGGFNADRFEQAVRDAETDAIDQRIINQQFDRARSERMGARSEED
jgi:hypothetical protein